MSVVKAAVGDALITFVWMFCNSALGVATFIITASLQIQGEVSSLLVTSCLIFVIVFVFNAIADAMGGASFNPTGNAAFYAAGFGDDTLNSMAIRFPAQAAGAIGGLLALYEVMPSKYKHLLVGPHLKVDLHTGAISEGVLTFVITVAVLCIIFKGPRSALVKTLMITICTLGVIIAGNSYTGPSMNPANAFGWAYLNNRHNTWEQFSVYWICPFIGAIAAAFGSINLVNPIPRSYGDTSSTAEPREVEAPAVSINHQSKSEKRSQFDSPIQTQQLRHL